MFMMVLVSASEYHNNHEFIKEVAKVIQLHKSTRIIYHKVLISLSDNVCYCNKQTAIERWLLKVHVFSFEESDLRRESANKALFPSSTSKQREHIKETTWPHYTDISVEESSNSILKNKEEAYRDELQANNRATCCLVHQYRCWYAM